MNELGCKCTGSLEQQVCASGSGCLLKPGHRGLTCCAVSPQNYNPPNPD